MSTGLVSFTAYGPGGATPLIVDPEVAWIVLIAAVLVSCAIVSLTKHLPVSSRQAHHIHWPGWVERLVHPRSAH